MPGHGAPTHAGAVVVRDGPGGIEVLLVTARRRPDEWVLPKGHIEPGEDPRAAAAREVMEETGVTAAIGDAAGDAAYCADGEAVRVRYFLARAGSDGAPGEGRTLAWLAPDAALARLSHAENRQILGQALALR